MTQTPPQPPGGAERYVRESHIATGGMGEVWRARDTVLGREVAVKVLKPEYAGDETFRARFEAEARHAASLHHPGIASVFDVGELDDGTPYLVMELVDGKPLSALLSGGRPFDPAQARQLVAQAADALGAAHAAGVVHRDVKPANLMVTPDGRIKVTDFGIARAADSVPITMTGQIVGTPHYLAPEQARGDQATAASDVYSLGVVLFECLAGRRPFSADSPVATALAHIREDVPPLPDGIPADLAGVVRTALAKDPAERYADGRAFAAALRGEAAQPTQRVPPVAPPVADATQVMPRTTVAPAPVPVAAEPVREEESTSGSRAALWIAVLLGLALLVLLLVTRPWEGDTGSQTPAEQTPSATPTPSQTPERTPSQTPTEESTPTPTEKETPTVTVDPSDYVGRPADDVRSDLRGMGLQTTSQTVDNPGDKDEGTVAGLSPAGAVPEGSTITLQVYGAPPDTDPGNGDGNGTDPEDPGNDPGQGEGGP